MAKSNMVFLQRCAKRLVIIVAEVRRSRMIVWEFPVDAHNTPAFVLGSPVTCLPSALVAKMT